MGRIYFESPSSILEISRTPPKPCFADMAAPEPGDTFFANDFYTSFLIQRIQHNILLFEELEITHIF